MRSTPLHNLRFSRKGITGDTHAVAHACIEIVGEEFGGSITRQVGWFRGQTETGFVVSIEGADNLLIRRVAEHLKSRFGLERVHVEELQCVSRYV